MKNIIVPTDFSECAKNAELYAVHLSSFLNAKITLLNTYGLPYAESEVVVNVADIVKNASETAIEEELKELKVIASKNNVDVSSLSKFGNTISTICEEAIENKASLIVMGTHGVSGIAKVLIGSNAAGVAKESKVPVLIIPEDCKYKPISKIVFAYDMQKQDQSSVLDPLLEIAKKFKAEIIIVNINKKSEQLSAKSAASGIHLHHDLESVNHNFVFCDNENIAEGIKESVHKYNADLTVMISRHHSFFGGLFHKSATKEVAYSIDTPLLVLPE